MESQCPSIFRTCENVYIQSSQYPFFFGSVLFFLVLYRGLVRMCTSNHPSNLLATLDRVHSRVCAS
jgi:hypothetical protein